MKNKKIIFMGTPEFASYILQQLLLEGYNVIGLICQPDRLVGRKQLPAFPATKKLALEYNIPVYQKEKIRLDYEFVKELAPDLIICCAYGQIIPVELLNIPKLGCLNVHGSLLPKYRGGAPIHRSIINGEYETGITLMEMVKKMDAGNMYAKESCVIEQDDTYDTLSLKMQKVGAQLLLKHLPSYIDGTLVGQPQDESLVSFANNISREDEKIDFNNTSINIYNLIRGLCSIPGAYATYENLDIKIYKSKIIDSNVEAKAGTIVNIDKEGIYVKTLDGVVALQELQIPGKTRMLVKNLVNGKHIFTVGTKFS